MEQQSMLEPDISEEGKKVKPSYSDGTQDMNDNNNQNEEESKAKANNEESYSQVQKDLETMRVQMRKAEEENKRMKQQIEKARLESLKEKENWQEIAKIKEEEASYYKSQYETLGSSVINNQKYTELKAAAVSAGLRQEALEDLSLLDIDTLVSHETTSSGRINVLGVKQAVDQLKASRPHWFSAPRRNINSSMNDVQTINTSSTGEVTLEQVMKAEEKARTTGDKQAKNEYFALLKKFNDSKRS